MGGHYSWTNVISQLLQFLHEEMGINIIKTQPYHSQTDDLVLNFNPMLTSLEIVSETQDDWAKWFPFLLFTYWDISQIPGLSFYKGHGGEVPYIYEREAEKLHCSANIVLYTFEMRERWEHLRETERESGLKKIQKPPQKARKFGICFVLGHISSSNNQQKKCHCCLQIPVNLTKC